MLRGYLISDDLDDLAIIEQELKTQGIATPQIQVLSENDAEVGLHHLPEVAPVLKSDVVHATEVVAVLLVFSSPMLTLSVFRNSCTRVSIYYL